MKITFRDLSFFSTGLIVAFLTCMIAFEIAKPKHVPATLAPMESDETHSGSLGTPSSLTLTNETSGPHHTCQCNPITYRSLPMTSGTIKKSSDPLDLYTVPIKGIYFNEHTSKLMGITIYGDYIEIHVKDIRLKKQQ